jgi:hypothetical protein
VMPSGYADLSSKNRVVCNAIADLALRMMVIVSAGGGRWSCRGGGGGSLPNGPRLG